MTSDNFCIKCGTKLSKGGGGWILGIALVGFAGWFIWNRFIKRSNQRNQYY